MQFKDVPFRTRRALSLYKVYGDRALLVLKRTSLNNVNALLALSQRNTSLIIYKDFFFMIKSIALFSYYFLYISATSIANISK